MWIRDPLVDQLAQLVKYGWSNPDRLTPLSDLLSLKVVQIASGGSSDRPFQIAALRNALQQATDEIANMTTPVNAVEGKAAANSLKHLLQLSAESATSRVTERRRLAAQTWGVKPETFRRHIQVKALALVAAELRKMSTGQTSQTETSVTAQIILDALRSQYGDKAQRLDTLVATVLPKTVHYDDVSIELVLSDHSTSPDLYELELRSGFLATIDEYVIAFVELAELNDKIMATCPEIHDVWTFSDQAGLEKATKKLQSGRSFVRALAELPDGKSVIEPLTLEPVGEADRDHYLSGLSAHERSFVTVLRSRLPVNTDARVRIATQFQFDMRKADHYCYWMAGRPMYIKRLTIDYSQLSGVGKVTIQPMLGMATVTPDEEANRIVRVDVGNWIVPGHGAIVTWSDDND